MAQTATTVKLAVIGSGGVGKTTLISRLATGSFIETEMTIGFDVQSWTITTDDDRCSMKASMFDFGGQKQFRFFQGALLVGAKAALLVFDCSSYRTLIELEDWIALVEAIPKEKMLLVGNKADIGCEIPESEISEFAEKLGIDWIIISSKTGDNFQEIVNRLKQMICM